MFYGRFNPNVCFILPAIAVGIDVDGLFFMEMAWLCWAVGVGNG